MCFVCKGIVFLTHLDAGQKGTQVLADESMAPRLGRPVSQKTITALQGCIAAGETKELEVNWDKLQGLPEGIKEDIVQRFLPMLISKPSNLQSSLRPPVGNAGEKLVGMGSITAMWTDTQHAGCLSTVYTCVYVCVSQQFRFLVLLHVCRAGSCKKRPQQNECV